MQFATYATQNKNYHNQSEILHYFFLCSLVPNTVNTDFLKSNSRHITFARPLKKKKIQIQFTFISRSDSNPYATKFKNLNIKCIRVPKKKIPLFMRLDKKKISKNYLKIFKQYPIKRFILVFCWVYRCTRLNARRDPHINRCKTICIIIINFSYYFSIIYSMLLFIYAICFFLPLYTTAHTQTNLWTWDEEKKKRMFSEWINFCLSSINLLEKSIVWLWIIFFVQLLLLLLLLLSINQN